MEPLSKRFASLLRPMLRRCGCKLDHVTRNKSTKKRIAEREERKKEVIQLKGENTKPVERVYVWGHAATGALGVRTYLRPESKRQNPIKEQSRPARLRFMDDNDIKVHDIACGYGFTLFACKRRNRYMVMATGINTDSQLGYYEAPKNSGRVLDYLIEPVVVDIPQASDTTGAGLKAKVACGRAHSVILVNNEVYAQGNNAYGQCGRSAVTGEIFHKVSNIQKVQDLPENVSKIVCGQDHTFFLTDNGELYSCGMGADGQTGLGTFSAVGRPTLVEGDIQGVKIVDVSSRADCVLAVSEDGEVFGWGNSEYHQLSMVTDSTQVNVPRHLPITDCGKVVKVAAGGSICALVNDNGNVFVWGFGILGKGPKVDMLESPSKLPAQLFGCNELQPFIKVLDVKCGMSHFAAYTDQGDMFTWGKGKYGCLGLHEYREQYFPLKVALPAFAHGVECGVDHTAALCTSFA